MSERFESVKEALFHLTVTTGVYWDFEIDGKVFTEARELKMVSETDRLLLDSPSIPEDIKNKIRARLERQRGFIFHHPKQGDIKVVVAYLQYGNRFGCWILDQDGNIHSRL